MAEVQTRRTDRIGLEINLLVSGTDPAGEAFQEMTRTLLISRHGAKIALRQALAQGQEISLRNIAAGIEADGRVVGQIGEGPEERYYGVELLDPAANFWGIDFPPISEAETAVGRVLLECVECHSRQLTYLNELETEIFETRHLISRPCQQCAGYRQWKRPGEEVSAATPPPPLPRASSLQPSALPPERPQDERHSARVSLRLNACIRTREHGDDVVTTENVSRGGFRCSSTERYGTGAMVVEVCVPYSPGPGSIFSPARIAYVKPLPSEGSYSYGIAHLHMHKR